MRKINRLRSIQSSLAIEQNTMSLDQVTAIINGKTVLGRPEEIREVKNAYKAYEYLLKYDPFEVKDFLRAHAYMTEELVKDSGNFRSQGVGVFSDGQLIHAGAKAEFVPKLVGNLFNWAKKSDLHPLIKSPIVHYEIEFIHPFLDGNGRIGRLWQTLILSQWSELFAWLPIETVVYENQQGYYDAFRQAERTTDSGGFIEFMLEAIYQALAELPIHNLRDILPRYSPYKLSKTELEFLDQIAGYLERHGEINNYRAQLLTNKSAESVKKYLNKLSAVGILKMEGENKGRKYLFLARQK